MALETPQTFAAGDDVPALRTVGTAEVQIQTLRGDVAEVGRRAKMTSRAMTPTAAQLKTATARRSKTPRQVEGRALLSALFPSRRATAKEESGPPREDIAEVGRRAKITAAHVAGRMSWSPRGGHACCGK